MTQRYGQAGPPQLRNITGPITESDRLVLERSDHVAHLLDVEECWFRKIKCRCGSVRVHVLRADSDSENWITGEYSGNQRVRVKCVDCGNSHLLFDDGLHGYNAVVCDERADLPAEYEKKNDTLLSLYRCPCGNDSFHVYAFAVYDCLNPEEPDEIPADQRDDGYGYFVAVANCPNCATTHEIASAETA